MRQGSDLQIYTSCSLTLGDLVAKEDAGEQSTEGETRIVQIGTYFSLCTRSIQICFKPEDFLLLVILSAVCSQAKDARNPRE